MRSTFHKAKRLLSCNNTRMRSAARGIWFGVMVTIFFIITAGYYSHCNTSRTISRKPISECDCANPLDQEQCQVADTSGRPVPPVGNIKNCHGCLEGKVLISIARS